MTNARPPDEKHVTIVSQPSERLYIARLEVYFQLADFLDNTEGVCRLLHDGTFVKIEPLRTAPWEVGKKFLFTLEGFSTQEVAKASGHRLAQSLLWTAVSMNFHIRLQQAPYVLPNRIRPKGNLGFMPMVQHYQLNEVLDELHNSYAELDEPDEALLLSMQIFAGAELEASPYARFVMTVTALEPLAKQQSLGDEVAEFVNLCVGQLEKNTAFPPSLHDSLCGRLEYLKRESVRQAIRRILQESFPGETTALKVIDRAYRVRSDIVHEGRPKDPVLYLEKLTLEVGEVLRKIYAARLGRELIFPLSSS